MGGIEALAAHGSEELKEPLSRQGRVRRVDRDHEPHRAAGRLRSRRRDPHPRRAGGRRHLPITGQKIFITYGEHDLTDNIVHLVLARLPDAPPGTRGISLFLVPKCCRTATRNDVRCHRIEHKLGIHASPTCTMIFGDNGGAVGWLIGEENRGLACMFTMMNNARLAVGLQGVGIAERAYQQALAYANERRQGRAPGARGHGHEPDRRASGRARMLLTMKALTAAARAICYLTAEAIDRAHRADRTARGARTSAPRCSRRSPRPSRPTSASRSPRSACRSMAAWASSRRPAPRSICATRASRRSTRARTASRRSTSSPASCRSRAARRCGRRSPRCAPPSRARQGGDAGLRAHGAAPARGDREPRPGDELMLKALAGNDPNEALAGATPYLRLFALAQGGAALAEAALAATPLMAAGDTDPGACRAHRALPLLRREHRDRRAGLEETVSWPAPASCRTRRWRSRADEPMSPMSLKGKTLFITGASRGIGLAIGLRAARDGANVVIAAKTAEPHPKLPGTIYTAPRRSRRRAARRCRSSSTCATRRP